VSLAVAASSASLPALLLQSSASAGSHSDDDGEGEREADTLLQSMQLLAGDTLRQFVARHAPQAASGDGGDGPSTPAGGSVTAVEKVFGVADTRTATAVANLGTPQSVGGRTRAMSVSRGVSALQRSSLLASASGNGTPTPPAPPPSTRAAKGQWFWVSGGDDGDGGEGAGAGSEAGPPSAPTSLPTSPVVTTRRATTWFWLGGVGSDDSFPAVAGAPSAGAAAAGSGISGAGPDSHDDRRDGDAAANGVGGSHRRTASSNTAGTVASDGSVGDVAQSTAKPPSTSSVVSASGASSHGKASDTKLRTAEVIAKMARTAAVFADSETELDLGGCIDVPLWQSRRSRCLCVCMCCHSRACGS
jgi:hypothetical protein